jgi:hypothetical protein
MLKFLEYLDPEERKLMKFMIANAKNSLIESRSKHTRDKPNNEDILLFADNLLNEILEREKRDR